VETHIRKKSYQSMAQNLKTGFSVVQLPQNQQY